jgi:hypothetical protein
MEEILRQAVRSILGSNPTVMEEAEASHLIVATWEGEPRIPEAELLTLVGRQVQASEVLKDEMKHRRREAQKQLSKLGRDALVIIREGNQSRYWDKYKDIFELLAERGFLKKTELGILKKTIKYELTQKGHAVIDRRITIAD